MWWVSEIMVRHRENRRWWREIWNWSVPFFCCSLGWQSHTDRWRYLPNAIQIFCLVHGSKCLWHWDVFFVFLFVFEEDVPREHHRHPFMKGKIVLGILLKQVGAHQPLPPGWDRSRSTLAKTAALLQECQAAQNITEKNTKKLKMTTSFNTAVNMS